MVVLTTALVRECAVMAAARVTLVGLAHSVSYLFVPTTALGMDSVMTPWRPATAHKGSLVSGPLCLHAYYIYVHVGRVVWYVQPK